MTRLRSYFRSIRWFHIPFGVGIGYLCFQQFRHTRKRERAKLATMPREELTMKEWKVSVLKRLPTNLLSRTWGRLQDARLPRWLRKPLIGSYVRVFGCDLSDIEEKDLQSYETVNAFFMRRLRPNARPIDKQSDLVSPCDGTFLHCGVVSQAGELEQVKGIRYSLGEFLGEDISGDLLGNAARPRPHEVFHCVIYLSPGDYHHFHAPTEVDVTERRHFPGTLLSTAPFVVRLVKGLFSFNERVALLGQWAHGFFAFTAVGAMNVGSIQLPFDDELKTNAPRRRNKNVNERFYRREYKNEKAAFSRGDYMGGFAQGSTIVLLFDAPPNFKFTPKPGQHVRVGESLGRVQTEKKTG